MSDNKIMGVLKKLKSLQEVLHKNGQQKVVFDDLISSGNSSSSSDCQSLEQQLKSAKEAVAQAVMHDLKQQEDAIKKEASPSRGRSWLNDGDETENQQENPKKWNLKKVRKSWPKFYNSS